MTVIPLGNPEPGSEEWDDTRRLKLGGSEVAAVLGLSPWESRLSLYLRKKGLLPAKQDFPLMEWGRRIEPIVRERFIEDHDGPWLANPGLFANVQRRWQLANPDAVALTTNNTDDLLEVKTAPHGDGWGDDGTDEIPVYYRAQILQYVDVFDLDGAWAAVLIRGADYRVYRINRDDEDIAILREEGERFVNDLINSRPPDIDRHAATYQAVKELHPDIIPGAVEIDPVLAGDYLAAYIAWKEAGDDKNFYGAKILAELGSYKDAVLEGERFAYRTHKTQNGQPGIPYLAVLQSRVRQLRHPRTIREALNA